MEEEEARLDAAAEAHRPKRWWWSRAKRAEGEVEASLPVTIPEEENVKRPSMTKRAPSFTLEPLRRIPSAFTKSPSL